MLNSEGQTDRGIKGRLHSENVTTPTTQHPHYKAISVRLWPARAELSNINLCNYDITDNAENVAHLRLLIKDHKGWTEDSGRPPPSHPVCAGNDGGNRHISEIVSLILEPVACESNGNDIDSTGDMLSKIKKLNEDISKKLNKENMVGSWSISMKLKKLGRKLKMLKQNVLLIWWSFKEK